MPVINGIKMACDACIRGHRSTKCDHGDSRVLMKVRKPGRPLTTCPHLQSQPCDCPKNKGCGCSSSVTVAFPKRQGCGDCTTGAKGMVKMEPKANEPAIPDVPAATAGNFKVKKSTHLAAQVPRARPQSYDGTFFQSIDLNTVNIVNNHVSIGNTNGLSMSGTTPASVQKHIAPALPNSYNQQAPQMPFYASMNGQTPRNSIVNGDGIPFPTTDSETPGYLLPNAPFINASGAYMPNGGYTPNGPTQQPILTAPYALSSSQPYTPSTSRTATSNTIKSCCSSKTSLNSTPNGFSTNSLSQAPLQQPYNTTNFGNGNGQIYNTNGSQSVSYTYPGSFAPPQQQTQNGQWSQNFGTAFTQQAQYMPQLNNTTGLFQLPGPAMSDGMSMQCVCGPECQCLGCMMHPQNDTTLALIKSMHNESLRPANTRGSLSPDTPMQATQDPFYTLPSQAQPQTFQPQLLQNYYGSSLDKDPLVTTKALKSETPESLSRTESPHLSLNSSPFDSMGESQQQELDPNNFFFVDYQIGGDCLGDVSGCQCGDDCQCLGCTIHQAEQQRRGLDQDTGTRVEEGTSTPEEQPVKKSCCG